MKHMPYQSLLLIKIWRGMHTTEKGDKKYWHVALTMDKGSLALNLSSIGKKIELAPYSFKV